MTMTSSQTDLIDPIAADFRNFLYLMWKFLGLPDPTAVQYDIAFYLQHGPRRRMVQAFRGVGKSWITAAFVLWLLYRNANERVLVVSASKERADAFSTFVKRMINEWDLLEPLRPEPGMRDSNIGFDVGGSMPHQSPSVRSVGITGQMTGGRASQIVPDDIETPNNALTTTMRERLAERVKEFDAILMSEEDLKSIGIDVAQITYLGTPQTEMSLYNALPERGYDVRIWPARLDAEVVKAIAKGGDRYAPMIRKLLADKPSLALDCQGRGAPTDPGRFHDMDLMEREASYGRSGFRLQFQLDTSMSDANRYPLKLADLMVMGLNPKLAPVKVAWGSLPEYIHQQVPIVGLTGDRWYRPMFISPDFVDYQGVVMTIDPSGRGGDRTGYAVVAMCNGLLYTLECGGLEGGYSDATLQKLADIAKRNGVTWIRVESNFGDGMFTKLLTPFLVRTHPCTTEEVHSSVQKEKRIIDTLEPVFNQHRIIFDEKLVIEDAKDEETKHQLFFQLTRITRDRGALAHDDALDALAMAVAYWVEQMDKDTEKVIDEHKQQELDKALEDFAGHVFGHAPKSLNWLGNMR